MLFGYVKGILIGLDVTLNALLGGDHYQTLSCRIGRNILAHGPMDTYPFPKWLRQHFIDSVFDTTV